MFPGPETEVLCLDLFNAADRQQISKLRPFVDALCTGIPCQVSSDANMNRTDDDDRLAFPKELIEVITSLDPTAVLLENVCGFRTNRKDLFDMVINSLQSKPLSYETAWFESNAMDHGAPTYRSRLFITAVKFGEGIAGPLFKRIREYLDAQAAAPDTSRDIVTTLAPFMSVRGVKGVLHLSWVAVVMGRCWAGVGVEGVWIKSVWLWAGVGIGIVGCWAVWPTL